MIALVLMLAAAPDYPDFVEQAREAQAALEYSTAAEHWESAIRVAPDEAARTEAHLQAGIARRIIGEDAMARLHFIYVLKRQPERTLEKGQPPRILEFFELVRDEVRPTPAPTAVPPGPDGRPPSVVPDPARPVSSAWWGVGVAGSVGVLSAAGGATVGALALAANDAALASNVQVERAAAYDERDFHAFNANVLYGAAVVSGIVAGGFAVAVWVGE